MAVRIGEYEWAITANDEQLVRALRSSENATRQAAQKIDQNFLRINSVLSRANYVFFSLADALDSTSTKYKRFTSLVLDSTNVFFKASLAASSLTTVLEGLATAQAAVSGAGAVGAVAKSGGSRISNINAATGVAMTTSEAARIMSARATRVRQAGGAEFAPINKVEAQAAQAMRGAASAAKGVAVETGKAAAAAGVFSAAWNAGKYAVSAVLSLGGPLLTVFGAIAATAAIIWKRQPIADWIEGVKDAQKQADDLNTKWKEQTKNLERSREPLRQQLAIMKGIAVEQQYIADNEQRRLRHAIDALSDLRSSKASLFQSKEAMLAAQADASGDPAAVIANTYDARVRASQQERAGLERQASEQRLAIKDAKDAGADAQTIANREATLRNIEAQIIAKIQTEEATLTQKAAALTEQSSKDFMQYSEEVQRRAIEEANAARDRIESGQFTQDDVFAAFSNELAKDKAREAFEKATQEAVLSGQFGTDTTRAKKLLGLDDAKPLETERPSLGKSGLISLREFDGNAPSRFLFGPGALGSKPEDKIVSEIKKTNKELRELNRKKTGFRP